MLNDIISDSITRIRNAYLRKLQKVALINSKAVLSILEVLKEHGYISKFRVENVNNEGKASYISVLLKYHEKDISPIHEIKRISKPGRRYYKGYKEIRKFKNGYGVIILSTSRGIMSNYEAYKMKVGGEVLCSVW